MSPLEGCTILNTVSHLIYGFTWTNLSIFFVIFFLLAGVLLFCFALYTCCFDLLVLEIVIALLGSICASFAGQTVIGTYDTYEVIIEDNVSFNDFNEVYEVIEHRGEIYIVKEREVLDAE